MYDVHFGKSVCTLCIGVFLRKKKKKEEKGERRGDRGNEWKRQKDIAKKPNRDYCNIYSRMKKQTTLCPSTTRD